MPLQSTTEPLICDVGSGPQGGILPFIEIPSVKVAVDPLFRSFRSFELGKYMPVVSVGEQLCFKDGAFDVVFSINSLDHAAVPGKVLKNISSCVNKNGVFMFMVHVVNPVEKLVHSTFKTLRQRIRQPLLEYIFKRVLDFFSFRIFGLVIASDSYLHPYYFTAKDVHSMLSREDFVVSKSKLEKSKFEFKDELFLVLFRR
jgi:SAM-dependent methyltransferase